jgi:hypothetical protein
MQQISYNMLFRWFVGLAMDADMRRSEMPQMGLREYEL